MTASRSMCGVCGKCFTTESLIVSYLPVAVCISHKQSINLGGRMEVYEVLRFVGEESVSLTIDDKEKCDVLVPRSSDADAANEEEPKPPPTRDSEGTAEVEAPTLEESPNEADGRG
eukprot:767122-Hanusia_phi.AAC.4